MAGCSAVTWIREIVVRNLVVPVCNNFTNVRVANGAVISSQGVRPVLSRLLHITAPSESIHLMHRSVVVVLLPSVELSSSTTGIIIIMSTRPKSKSSAESSSRSPSIESSPSSSSIASARLPPFWNLLLLSSNLARLSSNLDSKSLWKSAKGSSSASSTSSSGSSSGTTGSAALSWSSATSSAASLVSSSTGAGSSFVVVVHTPFTQFVVVQEPPEPELELEAELLKEAACTGVRQQLITRTAKETATRRYTFILGLADKREDLSDLDNILKDIWNGFGLC